jgi:hypothetical protein
VEVSWGSYRLIDCCSLLQISNPSALLSTFPGMLLKIQIECHKRVFLDVITNQICLLLKIEGQTNVSIKLSYLRREVMKNAQCSDSITKLCLLGRYMIPNYSHRAAGSIAASDL